MEGRIAFMPVQFEYHHNYTCTCFKISGLKVESRFLNGCIGTLRSGQDLKIAACQHQKTQRSQFRRQSKSIDVFRHLKIAKPKDYLRTTHDDHKSLSNDVYGKVLLQQPKEYNILKRNLQYRQRNH